MSSLPPHQILVTLDCDNEQLTQLVKHSASTIPIQLTAKIVVTRLAVEPTNVAPKNPIATGTGYICSMDLSTIIKHYKEYPERDPDNPTQYRYIAIECACGANNVLDKIYKHGTGIAYADCVCGQRYILRTKNGSARPLYFDKPNWSWKIFSGRISVVTKVTNNRVF